MMDRHILFINKCAKLDLPPECYPDEVYLKKIFRQNLSFFELFTQKVDTKYDVAAIRKNILIAHMKNSIQDTKSNFSINANNLLPKEFKKYIKYNELMAKIKDLKEQQKFLSQEETNKMETLEKNEVKIVKSKENVKVNGIKLDLLQAKSININQKIAKEEGLQKKIKDISPAKFSTTDSIDEYCKNINKTIQLLKDFISDENNPSRDKYWKQIDDSMRRVPNNVIFQKIIKELTAKIEDSCLSFNQNNTSKFQPVKVSEKLLPYLYQIKIIAGIEMLSQKKRLETSKQLCAETIQVFENDVESLLNASIDYSFQMEEDDIIGDLLSALIAKVNLEGKIQYCTSHVNAMKQQVEANQSICEYEQLVNDTRNVYEFIDEKITAVQEHVAHIHQINEKVNFSKISIMRMIQSLKTEKSQQHNRTLLNHILNKTVISNNHEEEVSLPRHEMELQQFLEIPVYLFDKSLTMKRFLVLNDEDVIMHMMQLSGCILNPHHFIEFLEKRIKFGTAIEAISHEVPSQCDQIEEVNYEDLDKQRYINCEEISSYFDDISKSNVAINSNLRTINSLFVFALENPLRKFVPKSMKFEGKAFEHYEKEYMLYYKMIKH